MSISRIISKIKNWFKPKQRQEGTIKFFDRKKRFGFIIAADNEYFFHAAAIRGGDYRYLQDGVSVTFVLVEGRKGLQADDVIIMSKNVKPRTRRN
jgi:CspA family cold shock protein